MTYASGIGGGIKPGPPETSIGANFGASAAGGDVRVFAPGEGGGFLDADNVVLDADVLIDVLFVLVMAGVDVGAVGKGQDAFVADIFVREVVKELLAEVFEMFDVG